MKNTLKILELMNKKRDESFTYSVNLKKCFDNAKICDIICSIFKRRKKYERL